MKNIIAYSMEKLYKDLEEADELFLSSGMKDMELYEKQLAEAARKAAAEHMAALYSDMDRMLCEDISRAEKYTIQRHDERQLLTQWDRFALPTRCSEAVRMEPAIIFWMNGWNWMHMKD